MGKIPFGILNGVLKGAGNSRENFLSWTSVRTLAEAQLLSKASYLTLAIVPILATLWEEFRHIFVFHWKKIDQDLSAVSSLVLQSQNAPLQGDTEACASGALGELSQQIQVVQSSFGAMNSEFPLTLALGFFASLSIVCGQLIYQTFAPQVLKIYSKSDFVMGKLAQEKEASFAANPSNRQEVESLIEEFIDEYDQLSRKNGMACLYAIILYSVGLAIIIVIIIIQSISVASASGFLLL
ncbi:hypothetical protein [Donghicola tyrosinivorans]|uniref:Uncharacterized protein n=1 Tax=Donghicola tyrosinivorans TaxID=1652492 RepID=A0A2T0WYH7_9RHOB|nr:hypothetical protein [Donghicola tyrosinivorans]PRY91727.1 hypothetical protein CLV74_103316 [Donghicola tyrosinivorans]